MWCNVPKVAGLKLQRVATRAHAFELFIRAVTSPKVSELAKVRLWAAAQPGAGEWCCLAGLPNAHVHLSDHEMQRAVFSRIGHPDPLIMAETRCSCPWYSKDALPNVPGPNYGYTGKSRPYVGEYEHRLGLHWHWCRTNGMSTAGHNAVSHAWLRALRKLGYSGEVYEVPLGVKASGKQVRGDGVAKNWKRRTTVLVWDARVSTSYMEGCRGKASKGMYVVTDICELTKVREKGPACQKCLEGRAVFLPVTCNSHGGLGRQAWDWLHEEFQVKIDDATSVAGKRGARLELETSLAEISCAVLKRNSMIMSANAHPQMGGVAPCPPSLFECVQPSDVMLQGV
jgi:hypothetical protein